MVLSCAALNAAISLAVLSWMTFVSLIRVRDRAVRMMFLLCFQSWPFAPNWRVYISCVPCDYIYCRGQEYVQYYARQALAKTTPSSSPD